MKTQKDISKKLLSDKMKSEGYFKSSVEDKFDKKRNTLLKKFKKGTNNRAITKGSNPGRVR